MEGNVINISGFTYIIVSVTEKCCSEYLEMFGTWGAQSIKENALRLVGNFFRARLIIAASTHCRKCQNDVQDVFLLRYLWNNTSFFFYSEPIIDVFLTAVVICCCGLNNQNTQLNLSTSWDEYLTRLLINCQKWRLTHKPCPGVTFYFRLSLTKHCQSCR